MEPTRYRISVRGRVSERLEYASEGLRLEVVSAEEDPVAVHAKDKEIPQ